MSDDASQKVVDAIVDRFKIRTQFSRQYDEKAKENLPGGSTRAATYYLPYPVYMERGEGCFLYDVDGNAYLDFHNNYTSLIHGHAHPPTVKAAQEQLVKGTVRGAPSPVTVEHSSYLRSRMPSLELVRYCNSGTEATMFAIRAARAYTGKDIIIKADGAYHGTHDMVEVNVWADATNEVPVARIESRGVPSNVLDTVAIVPFNDLAAVEAAMNRYKGQVAAVIMEPLMNGAGEIPPLPGYLKGLRELCTHHRVLMILDEVVTFRLSTGGMQMIEGIRADLTALGKIIGGGFAVGAFGGRRDIMSIFDSTRPNSISHSGTFNGNEITLAAGLATLACYDQPAIDRINRLGERLRQGLNMAFKTAGIVGQAIGMGSLATVHWRDGSIVTGRDAALGMSRAADLHKLLHLEMMNRGIFFPRRGQMSISTAITEQRVDRVIEEFAATLEMLKPYVAEAAPHLLAGGDVIDEVHLDGRYREVVYRSD